ncbi:hypothetical protein MUN89_17855 [Halobacillus salinarum]|uniref:Uncharacterized protein n=1 Tax=Halobacillus salinarum TaxID=2932257 RepID=A0ABY4EJN0_9BACI|nr:hypothetical protein [Halobacillus salinarum]UOQ43727.1 hypothetical protein MUN89_17855 [Halobacillus salinarum]
MLTLNHQDKTKEQTELESETKELLKALPKLHHLEGLLELMRDELKQLLNKEAVGNSKFINELFVPQIKELIDEYNQYSTFLEGVNTDKLLPNTLREINEIKAHLRTTHLIIDYALAERELEVKGIENLEDNSFKNHALKQVTETLKLLEATTKAIRERENYGL